MVLYTYGIIDLLWLDFSYYLDCPTLLIFSGLGRVQDNVTSLFAMSNYFVDVNSSDASARLIIGTMSGTSLDGLDAVLLEVRGRGIDLTVRTLKGVSRSFPVDLSSDLRALAECKPMTAEQITKLVHRFSLFHVELLKGLMPLMGGVDLVAVHGQTVYHQPPFSWQLVNPTIIAHHLQVAVVCDMRAADLTSGGQGAPITPLADFILFGGGGKGGGGDEGMVQVRGIVNLGGFCNVSILRGSTVDKVEGRDVCACNQLIDCMARELLKCNYDENGSFAAKGSSINAIVQEVVVYLKSQVELRRSLGTTEDPTAFVAELIKTHASSAACDLLRSGCAGVAIVIANALGPAVSSVILAGGGARNETLITEIAKLLPGATVQLSTAFGVDVEFREAAEIAILGALCQDRVPITLPQVTNCQEAVCAGVWAFPTRTLSKAGSTNTHAISDSAARDGTCFLPQPTPPPADTLSTTTKLLLTLPACGDRATLLTEQRNPASIALHTESVGGIIDIMQQEDSKIFEAMKAARPALEALILGLIPRYERGGRLVYIGCGTSGRLGVLDASECPPTYNVSNDRVVGIIAGGDRALRKSSEAAEDNPNGAISELEALGVGVNDTVVGIAAGGTTPYVVNALRHLSLLPEQGRPLTGLITCTPLPAAMVENPFAAHVITLAVGPEVVTGSTRMKAGTATKLALNTISTTLFIKTGKVFSNLMIDLRATNDKLVDRASRIIATIAGISREEGFAYLQQAGGSCKLAVLLALTPGSDIEQAKALLQAHGDNVAAAVASRQKS